MGAKALFPRLGSLQDLTGDKKGIPNRGAKGCLTGLSGGKGPLFQPAQNVGPEGESLAGPDRTAVFPKGLLLSLARTLNGLSPDEAAASAKASGVFSPPREIEPAAVAAALPALAPKTRVSESALPPSRFAPWRPQVTSPAANRLLKAVLP